MVQRLHALIDFRTLARQIEILMDCRTFLNLSLNYYGCHLIENSQRILHLYDYF